MGYTHYWSNTENCPAEVWEQITSDVKKVIRLIPQIKIVNGLGTPETTPTINENEIIFNGVAPFDYETFNFERVKQNGFCKTNRKPYDLFVCVTLLIAHTHAPNIYRVESDGNFDNFEQAIKVFVKIFKRLPMLPESIRPSIAITNP